MEQSCRLVWSQVDTNISLPSVEISIQETTQLYKMFQ